MEEEEEEEEEREQEEDIQGRVKCLPSAPSCLDGKRAVQKAVQAAGA
jgi:hypothetical protein